jgi:hypothetical protein
MCESLEGYGMLKIETPEEADFVQGVRLFVGGNYWVGARSVATVYPDGGEPDAGIIDGDGGFIPHAAYWLDGTPVELEGYWSGSDPNNVDGREHCIELRESGLQDRMCESAHTNGFFCEPDGSNDSAAASCIDSDGDGHGPGCVGGPDCDDNNAAAHTWYFGYPDQDLDGVSTNVRTWQCAGDERPETLLEGGTLGEDCEDIDGVFEAPGCLCPVRYRNGEPYVFCRQLVDYDTARIRCNEELTGSDLAIVETWEEYNWMVRQMWPLSTRDYWVGASDVVAEGDWRWVDDSVVDAMFWSIGNPSNSSGDENCMEMDPNDDAMNDDQCWNSNYFVCALN